MAVPSDSRSEPEYLSPQVLAQLRHALAQKLWYRHDDAKARAEVAAIEASLELDDFPELKSRVLDLKSRMLFEANDPTAIECALESYEVDRLRGDVVGIVHSLELLADIYTSDAKYDLAAKRLDEAEALANMYHMKSNVGTICNSARTHSHCQRLDSRRETANCQRVPLGSSVRRFLLMRRAAYEMRKLSE